MELNDGDQIINCGRMPMGYVVIWSVSTEHYMALGPSDWEGDISVDRFWCRRQAIARAAGATVG
jgi:hypothetical protein